MAALAFFELGGATVTTSGDIEQMSEGTYAITGDCSMTIA